MVKLMKILIKKIFSKAILHILKGNINRLFRRRQDLYDKRYKFCKDCVSKEHVKPLGEICGICGCPLSSKLRVNTETCGLNRWTNEKNK